MHISSFACTYIFARANEHAKPVGVSRTHVLTVEYAYANTF
jgi:hypothetical protein